MSRSEAYVGLGTNLGDRRRNLESALAALASPPGRRCPARGPMSETAAAGPPGQGPYRNAAVRLRTPIDRGRLLEVCLAIEADHGRDRRCEERGGPRRLDLDLLLYDDRIIDEPGLTVPHPRLHERSFVLGPLAEIAESVIHPVLGVSIECLRARLASWSRAEYGWSTACSAPGARAGPSTKGPAGGPARWPGGEWSEL